MIQQKTMWYSLGILLVVLVIIVSWGLLRNARDDRDGMVPTASFDPTPPPIEQAVRVEDPCYLQAREGFVTSLTAATQKDPATVCFLILNGQGLQSLPPAVGAYPNLRTLDVSDNQLTQLPSLRSLQRLETLILRGNQLTEVPESVYTLPALTYLDVRGNPLTQEAKRAIQGRMRSGVEVAL